MSEETGRSNLITTMRDHQARIEAMYVTQESTWASYSSLVQHRICPQRFNYARIRGLEKVDSEDVAVERDFGSWMHMLRAADALTRGRQHGSLKWVPAKLTCVDNGPTLPAAQATVEAVLELATEWWGRLASEVQGIWIERFGDTLPQRLLDLYEAWRDEWADEIAEERPVAIELMWTRRLPMPEACQPVELVGYVDEVYKDLKRNILVIRDDKFHKRLSAQTAADDMMDSQLHLYGWGAASLVKSWDIGTIQATAYDRARMVKPATPVLTATGTLSKSAGTDTDVRTYREWAAGPSGTGQPWGEEGSYYVSGKKAGQPKFGLYEPEDVVIARLSTPEARSIWFQRTLVPLNRNSIKAHLQAAVESAMDIERTRRRVAQTRAAGRNLTKSNCQWCDFAKLCRAEMFGGTGGTYDLGDMGLREKNHQSV